MGHRILYIPKILSFDPNAFITEWNMPGGNFTLPLMSGSTYNMIVDWGDGSQSEVTSYNDDDATHTYSNSGTYRISITGTCGRWSFQNNPTYKNYITKVIQWGYVNFESIGLSGAFYNCNNLTVIPNGPVTNQTSLESFGYTFYICGLTSIPYNFFDGHRASVNTLVGTFGINNIQSIPEGLLNEMNAVEYFTYFLRMNTSIQSIPSNMFQDCSSAIAFIQAFRGCTGITSNVPELWNDFPTANGTDCFYQCTNALNYADIPVAWK